MSSTTVPPRPAPIFAPKSALTSARTSALVTAPMLAGVVLATPMAIGALYSLLSAIGITGAGATGPTLRPTAAVIVDVQTWRSFAFTLWTAGLATLLALAAACATALWIRARPWWLRVAMLPMAVPHVAAALAVLLLFGQSGWLSRLAHAAGLIATPGDFPALVYDPTGLGLVLAFAWKEFPYLLLTAVAVLATQADDLGEVARTLGASPMQAFRRVTWPLLWRAMAPAVLATFAFLVGQYEMPLLLAPSDPLALPLLAYERSVDPTLTRRAEAHVLGLLALGLSSILVLAHVWWQRQALRTRA